MKNKAILYTLAIFATLIIIGACNPNPTASPLPSPLTSPLTSTSPLPLPPQLPPGAEPGPPFTIDKPVLDGATSVTGTGPANVPIRLVDVTEVGRDLAFTTIDANGRFVFQFSEPLQAGHSVGLQIGDLAGTQFSDEDFIYSETYYDRPYIGVIFDMASVVENTANP